jgi:hypothetical protein
MNAGPKPSPATAVPTNRSAGALVTGEANFYATNTASDTIVAPDGALTLTATVHGLPAYDGSNGMEGIVAT